MLALAATLFSSAFVAPLVSRPAVAGRAANANMQLGGKVVSFDQDGVFDQDARVKTKPPLKLLSRLEELGLLTTLSEAGVLSSAESAGLFSKLEAAGAFSTAEKLLPLADKFNVFGTLESLLQVNSALLVVGALALIGGEVGLITVLPD